MSDAALPHEPFLQHHFTMPEQQADASKIGMWLFLVTEILLFGGLFVGFALMQSRHPEAFLLAHKQLDRILGFTNTLVLLTSSFTMVLAVYAAQVGRRKLLISMLMVTMMFGLLFLGIKGVEYYNHVIHHQFPGPNFHFEGPDPLHVELFFVLYWIMTAFHALHVLIGVGVISVVTWLAWKGNFTPEYHNPVENTGLYWHLVDIIWIFLYPLLYLISHSGVPK